MSTRTRERALRTYLAEVSERSELRRGVPLPAGTREVDGGINFAFFSRHATRVRLELFGSPAHAIPAKVIDLDPAFNRTGDMWHVWVGGIGPGQLYAYRVDGPYDPAQGHRFNFNKLLLDPSATAITQVPALDFGPALGDDPSAPETDSRPSTLDDAGAMPKCVFTREHFHWHDDRPPRHVPRADGEDPVPQGARRDRRRADACAGVQPRARQGHRPGNGRAAAQLLGI